MRRRLLTILLLLLAGAVVNVGVAWGIALIYIVPRGGAAIDPAELDWWMTNAPSGFPRHPEEAGESIAPGITAIVASIQTDEGLLYWVDVERTGWPARSMEMETWFDGLESLAAEHGVIRTPLWGPNWLRGEDLPVRPRWTGFVFNTVSFGALLWMLFLFVPRSLRRHLRARRGLCPACAYPVGEAAVCSECGRAVGRRRRSSATHTS